MASPNITRSREGSDSSFDSDSELFKHEIIKHDPAGLGTFKTPWQRTLVCIAYCSRFREYNEADYYIVKLLTGMPRLCRLVRRL